MQHIPFFEQNESIKQENELIRKNVSAWRKAIIIVSGLIMLLLCIVFVLTIKVNNASEKLAIIDKAQVEASSIVQEASNSAQKEIDNAQAEANKILIKEEA